MNLVKPTLSAKTRPQAISPAFGEPSRSSVDLRGRSNRRELISLLYYRLTLTPGTDMNELIAPLLFAAIFSAGDGLQQPGAGKSDAEPGAGQGRTPVAQVHPARYRSVEGNGGLQRGERLPARYQAHQHVIEDWRALRLTKPPRGHQWVDAGGRYALVAIATGRVAQVVAAR